MSITGEPCALKGASTVRWGANGKGRMTYLASGLPNSCEDFQTTTVGDFAMAMFQTIQIEIHEVERALRSPRGIVQALQPPEIDALTMSARTRTLSEKRITF